MWTTQWYNKHPLTLMKLSWYNSLIHPPNAHFRYVNLLQQIRHKNAETSSDAGTASASTYSAGARTGTGGKVPDVTSSRSSGAGVSASNSNDGTAVLQYHINLVKRDDKVIVDRSFAETNRYRALLQLIGTPPHTLKHTLKHTLSQPSNTPSHISTNARADISSHAPSRTPINTPYNRRGYYYC